MSRYAEAHKNSEGPGDARPTALQIIEDEGLTGKLTDKVFLITGVSSGIGIETMRALYATGGHVYGTVRNMEKGQKAVEEVKAKTKNTGKITLIEMDNESLDSVRKGVEGFLKQSKTLNVIIANAGIMAVPYGKTRDGFEKQFGTNHVAHFFLFKLLESTLLASSTPEFPSRFVSVSSFGHRTGPVRFDDNFDFVKDPYNEWVSYGQAKTANIYLANEIERRYGSKGLHATSLHPGGIWTGLQSHLDMMEAAMKDPKTRAYMKSTEQGAATSVYAALSEEWKNKGGKYLSDCVEQPAFSHPENPMAVGDDGYATWAYDEEAEGRLWKESLRLVGLKDE